MNVTEFCKKHGIADNEVWQVRSGGAYAIKHAALERVAATQNITFEPPLILEAKGSDSVVALCVTGHLGDRCEWSIGEAAPGNNKNAYPWAMAEKRAKDRVILKLLNAHGYIYSEDEADDFQGAQTWSKQQSRPLFEELQTEIRAPANPEDLRRWSEVNKHRIALLPRDWQDSLRQIYLERLELMKNLAESAAA